MDFECVLLRIGSNLYFYISHKYEFAVYQRLCKLIFLGNGESMSIILKKYSKFVFSETRLFYEKNLVKIRHF